MSEVLAPSCPDRRRGASGRAVRPQPRAGDRARAARAAVVGATDEASAQRVAGRSAVATFRLYRNRDLVGVELGGALKNIVAIAAGAAEALGLGDNGKAAIVTRGLAEITRLGVAAGANPLTFAGLAGIGDILATCASPLSRNHRLGMELAAGRRWADIEADLPGVAEGAYTVDAALWRSPSGWASSCPSRARCSGAVRGQAGPRLAARPAVARARRTSWPATPLGRSPARTRPARPIAGRARRRWPALVDCPSSGRGAAW